MSLIKNTITFYILLVCGIGLLALSVFSFYKNYGWVGAICCVVGVLLIVIMLLNTTTLKKGPVLGILGGILGIFIIILSIVIIKHKKFNKETLSSDKYMWLSVCCGVSILMLIVVMLKINFDTTFRVVKCDEYNNVCPLEKPICKSDGTCEGCPADSECPSYKPVCNDSVCLKCTAPKNTCKGVCDGNKCL